MGKNKKELETNPKVMEENKKFEEKEKELREIRNALVHMQSVELERYNRIIRRISPAEEKSEGYKFLKFRKDTGLTQKEFAKKLEISQQIISRVEKDVRNALDNGKYEEATIPLSLKYNLLKVYGYDIVTDEIIDFNKVKNTQSIPIIDIKQRTLPDNPEDIPKMYCDKRWLLNEIGVSNAEDAFIVSVDRLHVSRLGNIKKGDILLFDRSQHLPSNKANLYAIRTKQGELAIAEIEEDWKTGKRKTHVISSTIVLMRNPSILQSDDYEILGKAVWNGSQKFVWED